MPGLGPTAATQILDGPYRPNRALDHGARLAECPAPDNLVWQDGHLLFTSGRTVLLLDSLHEHAHDAEQILHFESAITAMAAAGDGSLAIGLGDGGIAVVGGEHDGKTVAAIGDRADGVASALCFADPHTLFVGLASAAGEGSLWRIDLRGAEPVCLAAELAAPSGLLLRNLDALIVAEGARSRLLECATVVPRPPRVVLDNLPGAPARLAWGARQCIWLAVPHANARPEPYGLVVRLDADLAPRGSLHGSNEGRSRGVTSCLEVRGELVVACRADDALISVDLVHHLER